MSQFTYHVQPSQRQAGKWGVFEQSWGTGFMEVGTRGTQEEAETTAAEMTELEREQAARFAEEASADGRCPCCGYGYNGV